ncbi:MAG: AAA family ATPase [Oscillospiraceae bacterium]|nr:AAA family ATPase [Oscillospiraceae bacterium]
MKILNCHIENFGRLSGVDYEFASGLNSFCSDNGSGKSTLAAFIRVMFYGFEKDGTSDELKNERRRYRPWQGGVYGGRMTFEAGGKTYEIERTFGGTKKTDSFVLRDAVTRLESTDFSSEPGRDIFGIDSGSFLKTVFLSQNDCETSSTDDINAKLGNLTECSDDINNFENVSAKLKDGLEKLGRLNKGGSRKKGSRLYLLKNEIADLETEVRRADYVDAEAEKRSGELDVLTKQLGVLSDRRRKLTAKQRLAGERAEKKQKKERYAGLCAALEERKNAAQQAAAVFSAGLPDVEELEARISDSVELSGRRAMAEGLRLSEAETQRLRLLEEHFKNGVPSDADINEKMALCDERSGLAKELEQKRSLLSESANAAAKPNKALLAAGILLSAISAVLGATVNGLLSVAVLAIGVALTVISLTYRKKGGGKNDELVSKISELEARGAAIDAELSVFMEHYGAEYMAERAQSGLYELKSDAREFRALSEKADGFKAAVSAAETLQEKISGYIRALGLQPEEDMHKQLSQARDQLSNCLTAAAELKRAEAAKESFEHSEDIATLAADLPEPENMELLADEAKNLADEEDELRKKKSIIERALEDLIKERSDIDEAMQLLRNKHDEYEEKLRRYDILEKTNALLASAKDSLTARYIGPITAGLKKYLAMIGGKDGESFDINATLEPGVYEAGHLRDVRFLSAGRRDLVGICMRMALIDAMYEGEKPVIFLDDPFVNLDGERLSGGLDFLGKVAEEYQVLYFTCHESRSVK